MRNGTTGSTDVLIGSEWLDPLEQQVSRGGRQFLQELIEQEVTEALGRGRHGRAAGAKGYRHGHWARTVIGSFGRVELSMPRARVRGEDGRSRELHSALLPRYKRLSGSASALIAGGLRELEPPPSRQRPPGSCTGGARRGSCVDDAGGQRLISANARAASWP